MDSVNVSIVRQAYEHYRDGKIGNVTEALTNDVSWRVIGEPNSFAPFGDFENHSGALEYFDRLSQVLETDRFAPEEFVASGDTVVVTGRTFGKMKASKQPIEIEWVHVFKLKDGKISQYREFLDTARILAAAKVPEPAH
ncbi:nuclear transport factor 2 family protein [Caulobacter segnis]|uniref:nuclear transport factor 2 family protein n=1 Tax=Caulobacter segnis TaxID=88688 RepID=UPI001CBC62C6|nr:nuclear transport factor 2 family protein [Caulobacter segnis]UAL09025.1 nuclear transport factor 2 family protein [Caulobacter segnis]